MAIFTDNQPNQIKALIDNAIGSDDATTVFNLLSENPDELESILTTTDKHITHYHDRIIFYNSVNVLQMLFDCYNLKIPSNYGIYFTTYTLFICEDIIYQYL